METFKMVIGEKPIRAIDDNGATFYTARDVAELFGYSTAQSSLIAGLCLSKDSIHRVSGTNTNYIDGDGVDKIYQFAELSGKLNEANQKDVAWFMKYGKSEIKSMITNGISERVYSSDIVVPENINVKKYNVKHDVIAETVERKPVVFDSERQITVARCHENCLRNVRIITYKNEWWFLAEDIAGRVGLGDDISSVKNLDELNTLLVPSENLRNWGKLGEKILFVNTYGVREICSHANNRTACLCLLAATKVSGVNCEMLKIDTTRPNNSIKLATTFAEKRSTECQRDIDYLTESIAELQKTTSKPNSVDDSKNETKSMVQVTDEISGEYPEIKSKEQSKIQIFKNEEFGEIRILEINNEPWFVGKDVAVALGYKNTKDALATHVEECDKIMGSGNATPSIKDRMGREQFPTWINESGLYALIFGSKLESAKRFKHWVTSEVLPSIRKHGAYATETTIDKIINDPDFGIRLLHELKAERDKKKLLEIAVAEKNTIIEQKDATITEMTPVYNFGKTISESSHLISLGEFAKIIAEKNNIHIGEKRLFAFLRYEGVLLSGRRTMSERNYPRQNYIENGYFEVIENGWTDRNGIFHPQYRPMLTGKGQKFVSELVESKYSKWCNSNVRDSAVNR